MSNASRDNESGRLVPRERGDGSLLLRRAGSGVALHARRAMSPDSPPGPEPRQHVQLLHDPVERAGLGDIWCLVHLAGYLGGAVARAPPRRALRDRRHRLVYSAVLAPYVHLSGWGLAYDYVFHYVVLAATVIGFVFVGPRLRFRGGDFLYLAWPVLWLVYTMVRGAVAHPEFRGFGEPASHYPYRFLDIDRVSSTEVVGSIILVAALLVGCGFAYLYGERSLESRAQRWTKARLLAS
jgi:hypothetical protein